MHNRETNQKLNKNFFLQATFTSVGMRYEVCMGRNNINDLIKYQILQSSKQPSFELYLLLIDSYVMINCFLLIFIN